MELTHFDDRGNARMVDVGEKEITCREALARGSIFLGQQAFRAVRQGTAPKGDVLLPRPDRLDSVQHRA